MIYVASYGNITIEVKDRGVGYSKLAKTLYGRKSLMKPFAHLKALEKIHSETRIKIEKSLETKRWIVLSRST